MSMNDLLPCPYCGEPIEITFDEGGGPEQRYIEDCQVCCRPIEVAASLGEEGEPLLELRRFDD